MPFKNKSDQKVALFMIRQELFFAFFHGLYRLFRNILQNTGSFDQLTKGTMLTIEGYFKPEEWTDKVGVKHNRVVMVAVKFYPLYGYKRDWKAAQRYGIERVFFFLLKIVICLFIK